MIVHVITKKGFGYDAAERHEADQFHSPGPFDVVDRTGEAEGPHLDRRLRRRDGQDRGQRKDVVAITAAMLHPVGLHRFAAAYPERTFDVGIAEQHAATSAAGLALGGLHPVVAIYATFLNRAFDQVLMDVALHKAGVTFVLDRAGVTGDDGASHNGMWDMSILQVVPGLRLAAPRDASRLRELLQEAVQVDDAPTVVRFPKGPPNDDIPTLSKVGGVDVLVRRGDKDVLLVGVGSMATVCVDVATRLEAQGIGVTVVDPRWVKPVDPALVDLAREHRLVVSVEDNGIVGGVGSVLLQTLERRRCGDPGAPPRHPAALPRSRQARQDPRRDRAQRPGHREGCRRGRHRPRPRRVAPPDRRRLTSPGSSRTALPARRSHRGPKAAA